MMTRTLVVTAVLTALLLPATGVVPVSATDLHSYVDAQRREHGFPGVAVAVVDQGRVVDAAGFGGAGGDRAMTADTPTDIGSVAKTVTAVAVLQLVERGAVELDAPVRRYLPWFAVADPAASETITVRHLLNHTSGLAELDTGGPGTLPRDTSPVDAVRALSTVPLSAPVGTQHQYLNVGYTALALVVEAASGRPYPDHVRESVFLPLGMTRSSADPRDATRPDLAQGHSRWFGLAVPRVTPVDLPATGHGQVTSTARDLARLLAALANGGELDGVRVLSPASVAAMQTPPAGVPATGYGFGWENGSTADRIRTGGHTGAGATSSGAVVLLPDVGRGFVLLTTSEHLFDQWFGIGEMSGGVAALLAGTPPPGGPPGRLIGLALLAVFVLVLVASARGFLRLPRWRERSRGATPGRLVRDIAPHLVAPALLLGATYLLVPMLIGRPFTLGWTGAYFLPDVLLILAVSIGADLGQGAYKTVVVAHRLVGHRSSGAEAAPGRASRPAIRRARREPRVWSAADRGSRPTVDPAARRSAVTSGRHRGAGAGRRGARRRPRRT